MARAGELRALDPRRREPASGPGGPFQRILVPVDSFGWSNAALEAAIRVGDKVNGQLRVVHVRTWDPPGRFFFETFAEATSVVDSALAGAWARGAQASGVVIDAPRTQTAGMIAREAGEWGAEVIVLTRRPRTALGILLCGSVSEQVMRKAAGPVLVVRRRRR
jgi:nucleotide-binding universal stress UspA family protein